MKLVAGVASLFLVSATLAEEGFKPLFNGRDLTGWVNINCAPNTFTVTNGLIHCTGVPTGILRTEKMYQNFVLEAEWRHLKPKGNSGIYVWADPIPAVGQPFVRAVEVQVLDGQEGDWFTSDGDIFPIHGAKMVPENGRKGGDRAFPTEKRMKPSPEWNHYRIECIDGDISLAVNGKVVTRGHQATPRKGYIGLESEGSPAEFRNLQVKEIPTKVGLLSQDIAVPPEPFYPIYTGVDLSGWKVTPEISQHWLVQDWTLAHDGTGPALTSQEEIGNFILSADFRWSDAANPGDWRQLVGTRFGDALAKALPYPASAEKKAGEWNRLRLSAIGKVVYVTLNGQPLLTNVTIAGKPAHGPLSLQGTGKKVEWANLLLREAN
jgi:hypothetical protein